MTIWLICQILYDAQDKFIKEAIHLQDLPLVQFNLAEQFCLSLAQVLFLWIMILIRRILLLLILLLILLQLINLLPLLTHSQNPVRAIILINNWPTYSANSLTPLILIRLLVLILMQGELKSTSLTLSVVLSLTSSIIFCFNVVYIFVLIQCNLT